NSAVPKPLKLPQPEWLRALITYPQMFQGWSMFAPESPYGDEMVYVDAVTVDGRHVDPYNLAGARVHDLPVTRIPPRLGQDSFWCDYTLRIPFDGNYHPALTEWILRFHERTGRAQDRIVSFDAFIAEDRSPPPGKTEPTEFRTRRVLRFPTTK